MKGVLKIAEGGKAIYTETVSGPGRQVEKIVTRCHIVPQK
jgi:hypothetical protein